MPDKSLFVDLPAAGLLLLFSSIAIAWASMKFYDIPVRKWLVKRWMVNAGK